MNNSQSSSRNAPRPGQSAPGAASTSFDRQEVLRAAEQSWASEPDIRAEFMSKESFIAWRVAVAQGRCRVLGGGSRQGGQ